MFRILLRKSCQVAMRPRVSFDLFWLLCIFLTWSVGLLPDYLQLKSSSSQRTGNEILLCSRDLQEQLGLMDKRLLLRVSIFWK